MLKNKGRYLFMGLSGLLFFPRIVFCQTAEPTLEPKYQKLVKSFVTAISTNDREAVSKLVKYPLRREYPIPDIANKNEFLQRFDQVFDKDLRDKIVHSSISNDWEGPVGWRGIMLDNGTLWLDEDGTLIAVNYQSEAETRLKNELIEKEKKGLHPSLQEFEEPVLIGETDKVLIRIDWLKKSEYRYATWPKGSKQSAKPDLILKNGREVPDGSGGNHYFEFKNGEYRYSVYVEVMGSTEDPPGWLEIYKSGKLILTQNINSIYPAP